MRICDGKYKSNKRIHASKTIMLPERLEALKQEYTDQDVVVDDDIPELARLRNMQGRVVTISHNGRALVLFGERENGPRYDIELDYLKVIDKPSKTTDATPDKLTDDKKVSSSEGAEKEKLSPLEIARMKNQGSKPIQ